MYGRENERAPISPEAHAENLRAAVELASTSPTPAADDAYKQAIAAVHAGSIDCARLAP